MAMLFCDNKFYGIYYKPDMIKMMKWLADNIGGQDFYYKDINIILN
jgi:hypothetical protein